MSAATDNRMIKFIRALFTRKKYRYIREDRVNALVERHKKREHIRTLKECNAVITDLKNKHRDNLMLQRKDFEIVIAEKNDEIRQYQDRESQVNELERKTLNMQAKVSLAARKLNLHMTYLGKVILKSGAECQGVFDETERMLK